LARVLDRQVVRGRARVLDEQRLAGAGAQPARSDAELLERDRDRVGGRLLRGALPSAAAAAAGLTTAAPAGARGQREGRGRQRDGQVLRGPADRARRLHVKIYPLVERERNDWWDRSGDVEQAHPAVDRQLLLMRVEEVLTRELVRELED